MATGRRSLRFDPHVHTAASFDAVGSVAEVLARADAAGLDAVAITDHDTVAGAQEALSLADDYDVTTVPGVEVSTADGHALALGVTECPPLERPLAETLSWVRDAGGVVAVPHPFQRSRHGVRKRDLVDCDALEVFNAWAMTGFQNRRAGRYARAEGYPPLGGSDAHDPGMVGRAHTEVSVGVPPEAPDGQVRGAVLEAVRAGRTAAVGEAASTRRLLGKVSRSVGRRVLDRVPR